MQRWMSRLPRLRRLELYDGEVLGHAKTQQIICEHCPYFEELEILFWYDSVPCEHDLQQQLRDALMIANNLQDH